jgi:hypothetical protein
MDQLERDLLLLQQRVDRNREWTDYHIEELRRASGDHSRQLLEMRMQGASGHLSIFGASLKLITAMVVPLLVLALTGDLKQALAAVRMFTAG